MFVDTHCHLDIIQTFGKGSSESFDDNTNKLEESDFLAIEEIIQQAKSKQVLKIINVGCDFQTSKNSIDLANRFKEVWATIGIHPTDCKENWEEVFGKIIGLVGSDPKAHKVLAVGEIGLDFFHKGYDLEIQRKALRRQIEYALTNGLAIVFHVREAGVEFLKEVAPFAKDIKRAVIHCFQQDIVFATKVLNWGFFLGIDGPITYPKSVQLRDIVRQVPIESLVLETDSPFLPTQPNRGKKNYPSAIAEIASEVARVKGLSVEQVAQATTSNANKLFFDGKGIILPG